MAKGKEGRMLVGWAVLLVALFAGEALSRTLHLPVPGNVVGMVLLLAALSFRVVPLDRVARAADSLLGLLALFFVPAGVGLMQYFGLLKQEWLPIAVATGVSTFLVMAATGLTAQWMSSRREVRPKEGP